MTDHQALRRRKELLWARGRSIGWVAPLLLLAGITAVDLNTTERFRIVSWIVLVPGIAAALCGVWTTAVFAVLSVLDYVAVDHAWPHEYRAGLPDYILVAFAGLLAVLACLIRKNGERRMLHMRDIAETTRRTVLRPLPQGWAGLEHAAVYLAADTQARVGGDFYDIQPGRYGTRVLVGDVQGKGLGAVETAAALLGTFREAGYHERDLATVADRLETRMIRHRSHTVALGRNDGDRFATAVLLGFPPDAPDVVELINFGHEPPLAVGPTGVRSLPPGGGLPLGMADLTVSAGPPPTLTVALAPDETLLITTDGVTEARNRDGAFYPLPEAATRAPSPDPARLVAHIRDGVLRHSRGRLTDDTTIFAVRRTGTP
ncbi:MAG: serine/threonine-protein phosphatase [Streptomyces sp.]|uniref:PP2C family protein-serine/threonine phosphatase n=1 Tax=Streptomyces sp. TaxID=1931 RepID=UPI0025D44C5C|nr:PP2C family protein-serine/threonine phosphatase [Streptomyces sp.]MBW8797985.1 serine/threonine-protein phosphatase [Streptomyces sp.]